MRAQTSRNPSDTAQHRDDGTSVHPAGLVGILVRSNSPNQCFQSFIRPLGPFFCKKSATKATEAIKSRTQFSNIKNPQCIVQLVCQVPQFPSLQAGFPQQRQLSFRVLLAESQRFDHLNDLAESFSPHKDQ
ncbi:hypothetical protein RvY_11976 [Ramazzottius varieornatus]|uniref:Uncharacterized protein n=1 Tax=Ramazzottius varieornatus TaxID=947166 RepID=A0A1D1VHX5_RAMVA|nr:hypothetical protein RvY_11976 [Ramazzottius varieornatus]